MTRDWYAPIVADAEAGFGGPLNAYEMMKVRHKLSKFCVWLPSWECAGPSIAEMLTWPQLYSTREPIDCLRSAS